MALVLKDRVRETTSTAGTGTVTLAGAVLGFQSFAVIGNGNTTYYAIADSTTGDWEVGLGTYTSSGTTLSRDLVLESSNSGSLVNFAANAKDVFCTYPAERSMYVDGSSIVPGASASLPVVYGGTGQTTYTNGQLLIGNTTGNTLTKATLTQGTGITITNGSGSITIANAGVTSFSAGTTGFTPSTATTGAVSLAGTLALANGGTGQTTKAAAFNALSPITTTGDLIIGNGSNSATRLPIGANTYVLTSDGTTATWSAPASGMVYPGAGIPNSTGSAWGTSYTTTGSGTVVALATSPSFTTPSLGAATATQLNITAQGDLRLEDTTGGEYVAIQAPSTLASSYTLTMPTGTGSASQVLTTDGTGVLSWSTASGGGGATGGGTDKIFWENDQTVTTSYSIPSAQNAGTFGPITINSGATVTVPSGVTWTVV